LSEVYVSGLGGRVGWLWGEKVINVHLILGVGVAVTVGGLGFNLRCRFVRAEETARGHGVSEEKACGSSSVRSIWVVGDSCAGL